MPGRNTNQERPEGNKPFPGGIDKEERKGRNTSEGDTRDSRDAEMDRNRQAESSRESSNRDSSRGPQIGERQTGSSERSGSESTQRATQGRDMAEGVRGGKMNESTRPDNKETEDKNSDKLKNPSERERKDSSF